MNDEENPNAKLMAALLERMETMEKKAAKKKADKQQRRIEKDRRRAEEAERQRVVNEELERQRLAITAQWESDRAKFEEALGKAAKPSQIEISNLIEKPAKSCRRSRFKKK